MKKPKQKIESIRLKNPLHTYQPRLTRFLKLMVRVRALRPYHMHMWKIMDTPAFQDTETALKMTLMNERTGARIQQNTAID